MHAQAGWVPAAGIAKRTLLSVDNLVIYSSIYTYNSCPDHAAVPKVLHHLHTAAARSDLGMQGPITSRPALF